MPRTIDNFRALAGHRTVLNVRIARDETGRRRSLTINEVRYAYLEDRNGNTFYARVPDFALYDFGE